MLFMGYEGHVSLQIIKRRKGKKVMRKLFISTISIVLILTYCITIFAYICVIHIFAISRETGFQKNNMLSCA